MEKSCYIEAGKIANTHGIGGDVVVESYCDSPEILRELPSLFLKEKDGYKKLKVTKASLFKDRVLFHFDGYNRVEDAIPLKNKLLYALRDDFELDEDSYFIVDLIGLPIYDAKSGEIYGKLSDVLNYGASDIYEVEKADGKKAFIPVVDEFVKSVDLEKGIAVCVIEGLL